VVDGGQVVQGAQDRRLDAVGGRRAPWEGVRSAAPGPVLGAPLRDDYQMVR